MDGLDVDWTWTGWVVGLPVLHVVVDEGLYERLRRAKEELGARSWRELLEALLERAEGSARPADGPEELEYLRFRLGELEERIARLEEALKDLGKARPAKASKRSRGVVRAIKEKRAVLLSELELKDPARFLEWISRQEDFKVIRGGKDALITTKEFWEKFKASLPDTTPPSGVEANAREDPYYKVLLFLSREGLAIYGRDGWQLIEPV